MTLEGKANSANVYLGWGIRAEPTQLVLGPGFTKKEFIMADIVSKLKTATLIAGAALFVVACGEKAAETTSTTTETSTTTTEAPAADAMAPAADATTTDAMATAPAAGAADAAAPAADAMATSTTTTTETTTTEKK